MQLNQRQKIVFRPGTAYPNFPTNPGCIRRTCLKSKVILNKSGNPSLTEKSKKRMNACQTQCIKTGFTKSIQSTKKKSNPIISKPIPVNQTLNQFVELMGTQDIIEGSWTENKETKQIIARQDMKIIFEKIKTNIKETTKEKRNQLIITILILYYIFKKVPERINEVKLIIHKAMKYLLSQNIDYNNIIS